MYKEQPCVKLQSTDTSHKREKKKKNISFDKNTPHVFRTNQIRCNLMLTCTDDNIRTKMLQETHQTRKQSLKVTTHIHTA